MSRSNADWIEAFIKYTDSSEPPLLYREWVAVSVVAALMQRKCYLPWGNLVFYPNMYIILVGPSGRCRKGTAMGPGASLLREANVRLAAESITREALIRELNKSTNTDIDTDTGDVTIHSSLTIYSQEFTVFLGYNNVMLMGDLTDWYDCRDRWTYRTKNMGTDEIIGVWVNIIGATTPELIQTTLPRDAVGGGLTSRMIFVYEDRKGKLSPAPFLTPAEVELRKTLLTDLEKIGTMRGQFRVDNTFLEKYVKWYKYVDTHKPFNDTRFDGYFERRPAHLFKLSMIMTASSSEEMVITGDTFDRALDLLERTEVKMPLTFRGVGKSPTADVLSRVMAYLGVNEKVTFRELLNVFYNDADKETLTGIIGTLSAMGYCSLVQKGKEVLIIHENK